MSTIGNISNRTKSLLLKRYVQAILIVTVMTMVIVAPFLPRALALADVGNAGVFELDGNIVKDSSGTFPTDWGALFNSNGGRLALPSGGVDSGWTNDGPHSLRETTTFTTGSKDTLDIANSGWQCTGTNNLTPKDDILHAYSFAIRPATGNRAGHLLIYGAFERFANNGAGDLGYWLLADPTVSCSTSGATTSFTGAHTIGDLLVVGEFSTGGTVTTLSVIEWTGSGSCATPAGPNLCLLTTPGNADCSVALVTDNVCAKVNTASITTPWATQDKTSTANTLATAEFFEVGLDITNLLPGSQGCFTKFLFDTRTSPSTTATLKDYAEGGLVTCGSLSWTKFDNNSHLLGGATFRVCGPDVNTCVTVLDNSPPDADPVLGQFKLANLGPGTYSVTETVAPPGFTPDPNTKTATITSSNPDVVIPEAFVDPRPVLKLTEFGYTNTPSGTPTSGPVSGVTVYTVKVKNFGGVTTDLNGSLTVTVAGAGSGTFSCAGNNIVDCVLPVVTGSLAPLQETTFTLTLTYNNLADQAVVTASLSTLTYRTNGLARNVSGTPATIAFTIQAN